MPQSSGRGFKVKRTSHNKDIENCSLKSVSYPAFSSDSKIKLALHFSHIYKFRLCCENSSMSVGKITSLCIQGHNEIT